jgi:hypothetical protein
MCRTCRRCRSGTSSRLRIGGGSTRWDGGCWSNGWRRGDCGRWSWSWCGLFGWTIGWWWGGGVGSGITFGAKVANLPNRTFTSIRTMNPTPFIRIINPNPTIPMIARILTRPFQIRRLPNRIIRRYQRRPYRHRRAGRHRSQNGRTKCRYGRLIQFLGKVATAPRGGIAGCVFEAGFASGETEAFFGFAGSAILAL